MAKVFIDPSAVNSELSTFEYDLELLAYPVDELDAIVKFAKLPVWDQTSRTPYGLQVTARQGNTITAVDVDFHDTFQGQGIQEGDTLKIVTR